MVFDVTSRASFDALDGWLEESQKFGLNTQQIVVCANKVCMRPCHWRGDGFRPQCSMRWQVDKPKRVITEEEGRAWAEGHGIECVPQGRW